MTPGPKRVPVMTRILRNVVEVDGCWIWQGATTNGYGRISDGMGKVGLTHRIAYEHLVGPIPDGLVIDHLCRNTRCCNPECLQAVPSQVNTLRGIGITAVNAVKTHCIRDHEFTPENTVVRGGRRYCQACVRMHNANRRRAA